MTGHGLRSDQNQINSTYKRKDIAHDPCAVHCRGFVIKMLQFYICLKDINKEKYISVQKDFQNFIFGKWQNFISRIFVSSCSVIVCC